MTEAPYAGVMRMLSLWIFGGCMAGGGPVVGYGERGFVYGAEAGAGFTFANINVGAQHVDRTIVYGALSADASLDAKPLDMLDGRHPYGRIGGGIGVSSTTGRDGYDSYDAHGVFLTGLGGTVPVPGHARSCSSATGAFTAITVEVRYVDGWEAVLAPRFEAYGTICTY